MTLADLRANGSPCPVTGCLFWMGSASPSGYGRTQYRNKQTAVHRLAWILEHGPIPRGIEIRHKCDTPLCFEGSHLESGTHADNMADMAKRGRARPGHKVGQDHGCAKLDNRRVTQIRERLARGASLREVAREFGISKSQVSNIKNGARWGHLKEAA